MVKHAGASEINLEINQKNGILNFKISDNGKGIDETENNDGIGLRRINKGLEVFGGNLQINNLKNNGTEITIAIEVKEYSLANQSSADFK